ncbi:MAG: LPS assembly lipoprotein LptE [Campylobacterota bacterium]|nr:LPS assembly lipoprotein LptE [Campylobacterota bacterium]
MKKKLFNKSIPLLAIIALFVMGGCGYKPSSHYIKNVFDDTVYVEVIVSRSEPENAAYVKDALNRMIIARFGGKVVPKAQAESVIIASYNGTTFSPIGYDSNGYITRYRAKVRVKFDIKTTKSRKNLRRSITGIVEENIGASSTLSSNLRIEAIRTGMARALDQFLAYVSSQGALKEKD